MPFCRLCSQYLDCHPEVLSPLNQNGAPLNRLLETQAGGDADPLFTRHVYLPGQELHERAALEAGLILPPGRT